MTDSKQENNSEEMNNNRNQLNFLYGIRDIARLIYERKVSFVLITVIILGLAIIYSILAQPIYRATVTLKPPPDVKVASTGVGGWCPRMSGEDIFRDFRDHVSNTSKREKFFLLPEIVKDLQEEQTTPYIQIDFDRNNRLTFFLDGPNRELTEKLANKYISITEKEAREYAIENIVGCLQTELTNIEESLAAERIIAETELRNRIKKLQEAREIAKELDLYEYDPRVPDKPYFARGVKALDAEIETLKLKSTVDNMLPTIARDINAKKTIQRMLTTDIWKTHVISAEIENPTQVESEPAYYSIPIFQNRLVIWICGLIVGLLFSFFFVLASNEMRIHQKDRENK